MTGSAPSFPAFDEWQKMSESEQDALIDRMEAVRRRQTLKVRILIGLACAAAVAAIGYAVSTLV